MVNKEDNNCSCCQFHTKHDETFKSKHPPEILVLVINRFDQTLLEGKNKDRMYQNKEL